MKNSEDEKYSLDVRPAEPEDITRISDDVISTIAGIELAKIEGIHPVGGGLTDFLGRKGASKGIKVEASGDEISIEVVIIVDYGVNIPEAAHKIQTRLRKRVAEMSGKFVKAVNVNIQGIRTQIEKEPSATEKEGPPEEEQAAKTGSEANNKEE